MSRLKISSVSASTHAMEKQAPCHTSSNSINDAVLIGIGSKNHHDFNAVD